MAIITILIPTHEANRILDIANPHHATSAILGIIDIDILNRKRDYLALYHILLLSTIAITFYINYELQILGTTIYE